MNIEFEELTHSNYKYACEIERDDIILYACFYGHKLIDFLI